MWPSVMSDGAVCLVGLDRWGAGADNDVVALVVVLADRLDPVAVPAHVHARLVALDRLGVVAHVGDPNAVVIGHLRSSPRRKGRRPSPNRPGSMVPPARALVNHLPVSVDRGFAGRSRSWGYSRVGLSRPVSLSPLAAGRIDRRSS